MKRIDIETIMKKQGRKCIALIYKETDPFGVFCELQNGYLTDYTGHRVDRKMDIWGYLKFEDLVKGYREAVRVKFDN